MAKKDDHDDQMNDFEMFQSKMKSLFGNMPPGSFQMNFQPEDDEEDEGLDGDDDYSVEDQQEEALQRIREFNLRPREIRDHLDRYVISQDEAKKVLSVAICDHFNHVRQCLENPALRDEDYAKPNIILLGPTGVGKTYLIRTISKLIGVPFVKADATKFSETGYVGRDVEDLVRDLVKLSDNNTELAQYGIIYVDEVDKIAGKANNGGRDVSGRGVQINLLKLMEETEVNLHSQTDLVGQMEAMMSMMHGGDKKPRTMSTRHILFIVSGAFATMNESIKQRVQGSRIGFSKGAEAMQEDESTYLKQVNTQDFINYGLEPEFIGRLPVRVVCEQLTKGNLKEILLNSEGSILKQYVGEFAGYEIDLTVKEDAVDSIAEEAAEEKTGARGLLTVLERLFRDFKFELPSTCIKKLLVDGETVADPKTALAELLASQADEQRELLKEEVTQFAQRFEHDHYLKMEFTSEATEVLVERSLQTGKTIRALCEELFHDYQYGLTLISRNSGQKTFEITKDVVEDPDGTLSKWVVSSFNKEES